MCVWEDAGHRLYCVYELIHSTCHLFSSCHILFCSVHLLSMELICLCFCPPVYSMGSSMGGLECLHHLFLPGRRRPVQGETQNFSLLFEYFVMHLSAMSGAFVCVVMNVLLFLRAWLQAGRGVKPDLYSCVEIWHHLQYRRPFWNSVITDIFVSDWLAGVLLVTKRQI